MKVNKVDERFAAIIDAISYWLGYQFKIGRENLIHEASLRYPIADTITSKGYNINRIVLEQLHPLFKSKKIDLVIFSEDVSIPELESDDSKLLEVFEFKLAKANTSKKGKEEHQRVFDDIIRLAYYNLWRNKKCYFLMCGKYEDFKAYFVGQKSIVQRKSGKSTISVNHPSKKAKKNNTPISNSWQSSGIYKDWFSFEINGEKIIEFQKRSTWGLKSFQENYHIREEVKSVYEKSIKIKTTCKAITPHEVLSRTHAAGIWCIEGIKK